MGVGVVFLIGGRAALRGDQTVTLELPGKLLEGGGLKAGKDERSFDGQKRRAGGQRVKRDGVFGQFELLRGSLGPGGADRRRAQDIFDGGDASDGFLGEDAQFQRERAGEFSVEIDGASAHSRDDAGVFNFRALELDENDGLFGAEEIGHDAEDFQVEFFDLFAGEDGVGVALHAGMNLVDGDDFGGLLGVGGRGQGAQEESGKAKNSEIR